MKLKFKGLMSNQLFMIKKAWKFSKMFFICRFLIALLNGVMPALNALFSKLLIEQLLGKSWDGALMIILIIVGASYVKGQAVLLLNRKIGIIGDLYRNALLFDIQAKIVTLDYAVLFSPKTLKTKELATQAVQSNVATGFLDATFAAISSGVSIVSLGVVLSIVSKWVYVVMAVLTVTKIITICLDKRAQYRNRLELTEVNREISYYMTMLVDENYANDMRMYSISDWVIAKYKKTVDKSQKLGRRLLNKTTANGSIRHAIGTIELGLYYVFLAIRMVFFGLSVADFTMVLTALTTFSSQVTGIAGNIITLAENSIYIEAFRELMETENTIAVDGKGCNADEIPETANIYRLDKACFKYPGSENYVLSNVNLEIEKNKFYVIVGENGEGKTTLCKLICRLYDVNDGSIMYNGVDLRSIDYRSYRNRIGIVFQDYKYYALSIAENVAMNDYRDTEEVRAKIYDALCNAGLKEKIDGLPNGIDTKLGRIFDENGVLLSGGELQKLALARVLFKDQPIVILDEPSSALDAFAEDELIQTFNRTLKGKTIFYISHRLSVAKYADSVIFLHNHTVEAVGSHDELLASCDNYSKMYHAQAKHYVQ